MTEPTDANAELMKAAVKRSRDQYKLDTSRAAFQAGAIFGAAFRTPQPAQAQAGAVPLPKSYHGSTLTSNSHDAGCRVSFSFSSVAEAEAWHESIVDQRHGIKGGQHGSTE